MNDAVELSGSCLSNYAEWAITYEGAYYPTAEHLFQASRVIQHTSLVQDRSLTRFQ